MPLFMTQTKFTEESLKALAERPSNRPDAVARVIEGYGGKVLHYYWVFGDAALMTLSSGGAVESHKTTALLSNDEAMRAMARAGTVNTGYTTPREEWRGWSDEGGEG